jgi:peroxiredoxin
MTVVFVLSLAALWALVIFQTLVSIGLARAVYAAAESGTLESGDADLSGHPAPAFAAEGLDGRTITNADLAGRPAALLFVSPDCSSCGVTLAELEALHSKVDGTVVVMCRSERDRCAELVKTYGLSVPVVVDADFELSRLFSVAGAPTAVLIGADGTIETYGRPMSPEDLQDSVMEAGWQPAANGAGMLGSR